MLTGPSPAAPTEPPAAAPAERGGVLTVKKLLMDGWLSVGVAAAPAAPDPGVAGLFF